MRSHWLSLAAALTVAACGDLDHLSDRAAALSGQSITYVGKQSITDFTGLGQHLQYWPLFGRPSQQTAERTDATGCIELTPAFAAFKHHYLFDGRTFSNDALGSPIGTKTRGGYATWPMFTLPDGTIGRSGTFYDESNVDNGNNTVNELRIDVSTLHEFCLNLITDNTAGENNPDVRLEARSDDVNLSLEGNPDLTFDGQPDMYTFRYEGMNEDNVVKIRMQCSSASGCRGAGLGGMMVSDISTCTVHPGDAVDAGATDAAGSNQATSDAGTNGDAPAPGGCGCRTTDARGWLGLLLPLAIVALRTSARRSRRR